MKKVGLVLVAGGSGIRMGHDLPKQFIPIDNKSILQHTIDRFLSWNSQIKIVLVLPADQIDYWTSQCDDPENLPYQICEGGEERFYSVKKGLDHLGDVDYVMIHDGVRPFVSNQTLDRCLQALDSHSGVIPVIGVNESVRIMDGKRSRSIDRNQLRLVQTPQCFHLGSILRSYGLSFDPLFTDDASVFETAGNKVFLVEGNKENIKITQPEDLEIATLLVQKNYG